MLGGMGIFEAAPPCSALTIDDEVFRGAKWNPIFGGEFFRTSADQHHVLAFFVHPPGQTNRIGDAFDGSHGAGFERGAIHQNGIELNLAIAIQMRADACIERGIILEENNGRFDGVNRLAARTENLPTCFEGGADALPAVLDCFVRYVPGAAVNDEGRLQGLWMSSLPL